MFLKKENDSKIKKAAHKRAVFFDKLAKVVINLGGVSVIIAVIGILIFILIEALPLLYGVDVKKEEELALKNKYSSILLAGIDEYQKVAYVITDSAHIDFINLQKKTLLKKFTFDQLKNSKVESASKTIDGKYIAIGLNDGRAALFNIAYNVQFDKNENRSILPELYLNNVVSLDSAKSKIIQIKISLSDDQPTIAALTESGKFILYSIEKESSLFGEGEETEYKFVLNDLVKNHIVQFDLDEDGQKLMAGDSDGNLYYFDLRDKSAPNPVQKLKILPAENKITAMKFLLGGQSLIVADDKGNLNSWMKVLDDNSEHGWQMVLSHTFEKSDSPVTLIEASSRNKSFLAANRNGEIRLIYLTDAKTLAKINDMKIPIVSVVYSPKSNGAIVAYKDGTVINYFIDNPHPEASMKALFAKNWYEGYKQPEYVWQSTGGTDSFEPKLSMIPLVIGTFKGTFYAMFFAVPFALLGALYTSSFSHPKIKGKIKPVVELMAALPSVVIGFLAGLWLAPLLEKVLPAVFLMIFIFPVMIFFGVLIWKNFPKLHSFVKEGYEIILIVPLLILGAVISNWIAPFFENVFLGGDYRLFLSNQLNQNYDQRNAIVVGFAMGFAVIPIIFTICEDALSSVPQHLSSASLALGASKWQTATRVVLPTASPGIFSAIMIGFGRAIGETMIVLMATGNTPILSFSPFNGMRTLSANIAVEIPEAPYHGSLYRVLFVSAALLFLLTFIFNTVGEIVRQKLRKKYMHI